jgi:hypothetical protein
MGPFDAKNIIKFLENVCFLKYVEGVLNPFSQNSINFLVYFVSFFLLSDGVADFWQFQKT